MASGQGSEQQGSDRRTMTRRTSSRLSAASASRGETENAPADHASAPGASAPSAPASASSSVAGGSGTPTSRRRYVQHDPTGVRRRGPSVNMETNKDIAIVPGARISLTLDSTSLKFIGGSASLLATEIGIVVRTPDTLLCSKWKLVPGPEKERMIHRLDVSIKFNTFLILNNFILCLIIFSLTAD